MIIDITIVIQVITIVTYVHASEKPRLSLTGIPNDGRIRSDSEGNRVVTVVDPEMAKIHERAEREGWFLTREDKELRKQREEGAALVAEIEETNKILKEQENRKKELEQLRTKLEKERAEQENKRFTELPEHHPEKIQAFQTLHINDITVQLVEQHPDHKNVPSTENLPTEIVVPEWIVIFIQKTAQKIDHQVKSSYQAKKFKETHSRYLNGEIGYRSEYKSLVGAQVIIALQDDYVGAMLRIIYTYQEQKNLSRVTILDLFLNVVDHDIDPQIRDVICGTFEEASERELFRRLTFKYGKV